MNEFEAAKARREFLNALRADLEKRRSVVSALRGRFRGELTVGTQGGGLLAVSVRRFERPEWTRVAVNGLAEFTALTGELHKMVRGVAGWVLVVGHSYCKDYAWSPAAAVTLDQDAQERLTSQDLIADIPALYDHNKILDVILSQIQGSYGIEEELRARGHHEEANGVAEDRWESLCWAMEMLYDLPSGVLTPETLKLADEPLLEEASAICKGGAA